MASITDHPLVSNSEPARAPDAPADGERLLEHEYDGIREYDNPLPRWWVLIFWGSFVFSFGYYFWYQLAGKGPSVAQNYAAEMQELRAEQARQALSQNVSEEGLAKLAQNPDVLAEAKGMFAQRCTPCHGDRGQGLIGPNLTDNYWIHGGSLLEVYKTVSTGVAAKGMPAWDAQLKPGEIKKLVALIGSFHGKSVPGKAPEGELVSQP